MTILAIVITLGLDVEKEAFIATVTATGLVIEGFSASMSSLDSVFDLVLFCKLGDTFLKRPLIHYFTTGENMLGRRLGARWIFKTKCENCFVHRHD